jgi:AcrR family transcriptional regulator
MHQVKSRREMYSAATRAALLEQATALFAECGYTGTSLEDVASASQVTRGAVYHHFASKQALFESVLDEQETNAIQWILAAASGSGPQEATTRALDALLTQCCDPVYGRLVWLEAPTVLGWDRWRERQQAHAYGLVEQFIRALIETGCLEDKAAESLVRFCFWMLGGAALALAEAPAADKPRIRDEWSYLIRRAMNGLAPGNGPGAG